MIPDLIGRYPGHEVRILDDRQPVSERNLPGGCGEYCVKVGNAVGHGNGKGETGDEADDEGADDGSRYHSGRIFALLGEMDGPVDAGIHIVGRYQSSEEADAVAPAAFIDECAPDERGVLFR